MDVASIITIIIAIVVIYCIIRFVVSPLIRLIAGIIVFLIVIYILQNYFNFSFNQFLGPFSKYIDIDKIINSFNWIISPIASYINKVVSFFKLIWGNVPKTY